MGEVTVDYIFGEQVTFQTVVQTDQPITQALIFYRSDGAGQTSNDFATTSSLGNGAFEILYQIAPLQGILRAFAQVTYWYEITLADGQVYTSPSYAFRYDDNRFQWQTLDNHLFRVHWYDGDTRFAQTTLDVTEAGLKRVQALLPIQMTAPIDIYIYPSASELQDTLNLAGQNWIAGHADPDLQVMVVTLPSGAEQRLLMEQRIPHELMHIMLYQYLGEAYSRLPAWLNEGLASITELYPNPDYQILLDTASQRGKLIPMDSLCKSFPRDASSAVLAYAQAASFTRYLYQSTGSSGLDALTRAYADGMDCQHGAENALGQSLNQLERQWRQETFAENATLTAVGNLLPWGALLIAALAAPVGISIGRLRRHALTYKTT